MKSIAGILIRATLRLISVQSLTKLNRLQKKGCNTGMKVREREREKKSRASAGTGESRKGNSLRPFGCNRYRVMRSCGLSAGKRVYILCYRGYIFKYTCCARVRERASTNNTRVTNRIFGYTAAAETYDAPWNIPLSRPTNVCVNKTAGYAKKT